LNPAKLVLGVEEVSFLGHALSFAGIRVNPEKVRVIKNFPPAKESETGSAYFGMSVFYCRFIPNFSRISEPLNSSNSKNATFLWRAEQQKAFDAIKAALCEEMTSNSRFHARVHSAV
jgi:hypothetical protein